MLALAQDISVGVEASGWTLERWYHLDKLGVQSLVSMAKQKKIELIAGGYNQIVIPIAPREVNALNFSVGQSVYEDMGFQRPHTLLIPEQCWEDITPPPSTWFRNVIMEYNEVAFCHPEWSKCIGFHPVMLRSVFKDKHPIRVIWSDYILWQKVQRFISGASLSHPRIPEELGEEHNHCTLCSGERHKTLYCGDAEVIGYRPNAIVPKGNEWSLFYRLLKRCMRVGNQFILPRDVSKKVPGIYIDDVFPTGPVPVLTKKQVKFQVMRWAVTGIAGEVNRRCWDLHFKIKRDNINLKDLPMTLKKNILKIWGSDYRTTTCTEKQTEFLHLINSVERAGGWEWN